MSELTKKESFERFREGLKRAASCVRECAAGTGNNSWLDVARHLDQIRKTGERLETLKALSELERDVHIDRIKDQQHKENMVEQAVRAYKPVVH